jgi:hypothetical protein
MQNKDINTENKVIKTSLLIGLINLTLSPLYLIDTKLGLTASIAANTYLLHQLYELGKRRRLGSNILHGIHTFFSSQTNLESLELDNALRNIINGGEAIYDELSTSFEKK